MAQPQPVITYDAAKLGISAIVTWVWAAAPDPAVQIIATVLGVLLYGGLTWWTQHVVTPLSSPQDADGTPLVRAGRHALPDEPAG